MSHSAQARKHEESLSFLSPEQLIAEGPWTLPQQRLLEVLQHREDQDTSITELCRLAGFPSRTPWHQALEDEHFAAVVQTFGIKITRNSRKIPDLRATHSKQRLLAVLQRPENRKKPLTEICHLAGFASKVPWMNAIKDELFVAKVEALGVAVKRRHRPSHRCRWSLLLILKKN